VSPAEALLDAFNAGKGWAASGEPPAGAFALEDRGGLPASVLNDAWRAGFEGDRVTLFRVARDARAIPVPAYPDDSPEYRHFRAGQRVAVTGGSVTDQPAELTAAEQAAWRAGFEGARHLGPALPPAPGQVVENPYPRDGVPWVAWNSGLRQAQDGDPCESEPGLSPDAARAWREGHGAAHVTASEAEQPAGMAEDAEPGRNAAEAEARQMILDAGVAAARKLLDEITLHNAMRTLIQAGKMLLALRKTLVLFGEADLPEESEARFGATSRRRRRRRGLDRETGAVHAIRELVSEYQLSQQPKQLAELLSAAEQAHAKARTLLQQATAELDRAAKAAVADEPRDEATIAEAGGNAEALQQQAREWAERAVKLDAQAAQMADRIARRSPGMDMRRTSDAALGMVGGGMSPDDLESGLGGGPFGAGSLSGGDGAAAWSDELDGAMSGTDGTSGFAEYGMD